MCSSDLYGLATLGLRFFNVYGPRQDPQSPYSGVISKWHGALIAGAPVRIFGDGRQTRDFVYVGDIARVNVRALAAPDAGVCNVGTGTSVTLLDMLAFLERAAGRIADRRHEAGVDGDIRFSATTTERLRERIGFVPPTGLESGLRELLARSVDRVAE